MTERPEITPGPPLSVVDAAARVMSEQVKELRRQGRKVRKTGTADAVHDMRVATRRLRTAMRALKEHVAPPRGLRDRLRWLAGKLGAVRDQDVMLALLGPERLVGASRGERQGLARLVKKLSKRRHRALRALRHALERPRWHVLRTQMEAFAERPGAAHADHHMAARVLTDVSELLVAEVARSEGMSLAQPDEKQLHQLRILFKRLRYALDFHAAASGLSYETERRTARAMQDVLGEIHDRDLLRGWLERGRGPFAGQWPVLTARLAAQRARLMRRFARLKKEWSARTRPEPAVAPLEPPRFVNLEVQPVTLRLVSGTKRVASGMVG